ncbi:hypothetical protein MCO_00586 [Bartonella sp. DB5-6]|uniref:DUF6990 domain-containing protein n=1 Tax=Bartonella sp. DB5-6 TaxID=1094755 RepID=UPI00026E8FB8|nr:hypothetical protein [Bartonella sp. DB5-6]EJF78601.1 hypothetical protein MCO_00586 [Bartonella sp. DB5-6]
MGEGDFGLHEMLRFQYSAPLLEKETVDWSTDETIGAPYTLLHFATLALLGDMETLRSYQRSFAAADRFGFASTETTTLVF